MRDPLLTARDVQALLRISARTFYRYRHRPDFPRPLKLSERAHRWRESEVLQWAGERK